MNLCAGALPPIPDPPRILTMSEAYFRRLVTVSDGMDKLRAAFATRSLARAVVTAYELAFAWGQLDLRITVLESIVGDDRAVADWVSSGVALAHDRLRGVVRDGREFLKHHPISAAALRCPLRRFEHRLAAFDDRTWAAMDADVADAGRQP